MNAGFIGTGNMGSILIEALIHSGAFLPQQIIATNRSFAKVARLADKFPNLNAVTSNCEVAERSAILFLCVKPLEFKHVLAEIRDVVVPSQIIVSITSSVLIRHLENQVSSKIAKIIPSITNQVLEGVSLCMYGERMNQEDRNILNHIMNYISKPVEIQETHTRVCSDLSSCGPAFIAYLIRNLAEAASAETGLDRQIADQLVAEMLLGTATLLTEGGMTPEQLEQCVSVPGGITAEGIKLLERETKGVFHKLIQITHAKYAEDLEKVELGFLTDG